MQTEPHKDGRRRYKRHSTSGPQLRLPRIDGLTQEDRQLWSDGSPWFQVAVAADAVPKDQQAQMHRNMKRSTFIVEVGDGKTVEIPTFTDRSILASKWAKKPGVYEHAVMDPMPAAKHISSLADDYVVYHGKASGKTEESDHSLSVRISSYIKDGSHINRLWGTALLGGKSLWIRLLPTEWDAAKDLETRLLMRYKYAWNRLENDTHLWLAGIMSWQDRMLRDTLPAKEAGGRYLSASSGKDAPGLVEVAAMSLDGRVEKYQIPEMPFDAPARLSAPIVVEAPAARPKPRVGMNTTKTPKPAESAKPPRASPKKAQPEAQPKEKEAETPKKFSWGSPDASPGEEAPAEAPAADPKPRVVMTTKKTPKPDRPKVKKAAVPENEPFPSHAVRSKARDTMLFQKGRASSGICAAYRRDGALCGNEAGKDGLAFCFYHRVWKDGMEFVEQPGAAKSEDVKQPDAAKPEDAEQPVAAKPEDGEQPGAAKAEESN